MEDAAVLDAPAAEPEIAETPDGAAPPVPEAPEIAPEMDAADATRTARPEEAKDAEDIYAGGEGQKIPPKFTAIFKQHPELRSMFFENREVRQHGGVKKLLEAATTLEEIGGRDAVAALEGEVGAWQKMDEAFSAGDPALAEHLFAVDADAASKLAPALIEQFAQHAPDAYSHVLGRAMLNTMQGLGVYPAIVELSRLAGENPKIKEAIGPLVQFWNAVFDVAQRAPEKTVDPERQKLDADRQAFEQEREKTFIDGVISDAKGHLETAMESQLGKFFKQGGIDFAGMRTKEPETWKMVIEHCDRKVAAAINNDQVFQRNKAALQQARDAAGLKKLYRDKIERAMPEIAKDAHARFTRFGAAPSKAAAPGVHGISRAAANAAAEVRVPKRPSEMGLKIDYSRVPPGFADVQSAIYAGRAYIKGRQGLHVWK